MTTRWLEAFFSKEMKTMATPAKKPLSNGRSGRTFDSGRVAVSIGVSAALGLGLAAAFLHHASRTRDVGPTAGALDDAFSMIFGACLGLLVGSAVGAVVRRGSRLVAGLIAGFLGYWLAIAPFVVATAPSDVTTSKDVGFVLFVFIPAAIFVIVGAASGRFLHSWLAADRLRRGWR